jgi:hypothetical protein
LVSSDFEMLETVGLVAAGYAGFEGWPWWSAALMGAAAGVWNASHRYFLGPWRDRLLSYGATHSQALKVLLFTCAWTGSVTAMLFVGIYLAASVISTWLG